MIGPLATPKAPHGRRNRPGLLRKLAMSEPPRRRALLLGRTAHSATILPVANTIPRGAIVWKSARRLLLPVAAALLLAGCEKVEQGEQTLPTPWITNDEVQGFPPGLPEPPILAPPPLTVTERDTIKVASFNIQVFGTSKLGKPEVMDILAKVMRRFDVVAIQEVRSKDTTLLPKFVQMINAGKLRVDGHVSKTAEPRHDACPVILTAFLCEKGRHFMEKTEVGGKLDALHEIVRPVDGTPS